VRRFLRRRIGRGQENCPCPHYLRIWPYCSGCERRPANSFYLSYDAFLILAHGGIAPCQAYFYHRRQNCARTRNRQKVCPPTFPRPASTPNPNGIPPPSPGLEGSDYPGCPSPKKPPTPTGLCLCARPPGQKSVVILIQSHTYFSSHSISCLRSSARNSS